MVDQGFLPDDYTYEALMDSLCKQGQNKEAHKLLDLMLERDLKPSIVPYTSLFLGYATDGTLIDVMNILDFMLLNNVQPDFGTYDSLVEVCTLRMEKWKNGRGYIDHW